MFITRRIFNKLMTIPVFFTTKLASQAPKDQIVDDIFRTFFVEPVYTLSSDMNPFPLIDFYGETKDELMNSVNLRSLEHVLSTACEHNTLIYDNQCKVIGEFSDRLYSLMTMQLEKWLNHNKVISTLLMRDTQKNRALKKDAKNATIDVVLISHQAWDYVEKFYIDFNTSYKAVPNHYIWPRNKTNLVIASAIKLPNKKSKFYLMEIARETHYNISQKRWEMRCGLACTDNRHVILGAY